MLKWSNVSEIRVPEQAKCTLIHFTETVNISEPQHGKCP